MVFLLISIFFSFMVQQVMVRVIPHTNITEIDIKWNFFAHPYLEDVSGLVERGGGDDGGGDREGPDHSEEVQRGQEVKEHVLLLGGPGVYKGS